MAAVGSVPPPGRSSGARIALALALQAGFHLLGFGIVALLLVALVLSVSWVPQMTPVLIILIGAVGLATWRGLVATFRGERRQEPVGLAVGRTDQPALWQMVDEVAGAVGARAPDRLVLVPEANAAVWERTSVGGLVGGPRTMEVGLCLLNVLSPDELRAVVAHELGHLSGGDTRFGPVVYRGMIAMRAALSDVDDGGFGVVFHAYGRAYLRRVQRICREQERSADHRAAVATSPAALAGALATLQAASLAWELVLREYVGPAWRQGRDPQEMFDWYSAIWVSEARREQLLQAVTVADEVDPYDSHPPLAERLHALASSGLRPEEALARRQPPALELVAHRSDVARCVAAALTADAVGRALPPVTAADFGSAVAAPSAVERAAELLAMLRRLIPPSPSTPAGLLDALAAGSAERHPRPLPPGHAGPAPPRAAGGRPPGAGPGRGQRDRPRPGPS